MSAALIWSVLTSRVAGPVATALAAVLASLLIAATMAHGAQKARADGLKRDRDGWRAAAGRWEAAARDLSASFARAEAQRRRESELARLAVADAGRACDARVTAARRSARAIETIINQEAPNDANGCPARGFVPRERLRDALSPAG